MSYIFLFRSIIYKEPTGCKFEPYCFSLTSASTLYKVRTLSATIIRSNKNCSNSHWCVPCVGISNVFTSVIYIKQVKTFIVNYPADVPFISSKHIKCIFHCLIVQQTSDLARLYGIYIIPTHDTHQWLLLQLQYS